MKSAPVRISLDEWDVRLAELEGSGFKQPPYGGALRRHLLAGDLRLGKLQYDNSAAALNLWNFLLTEEDRLYACRRAGRKIIGAMKDLGTVPVMAYSLPGVTAFYPDGAWWTPCVMEMGSGVLSVADSLGIDDSFCPVRAMLGAFVSNQHFPVPDLMVCSVGATCDDFSAIAQRLNGLGYPVFWWEVPHRREAGPGEEPVRLPGGFSCAAGQVAFVMVELERVRRAVESVAGTVLDDAALAAGISAANAVRAVLRELRQIVFEAPQCPLPALELMIAEMLALHFCSDRDECIAVLAGLLEEVNGRVAAGCGFLGAAAVRVFWVNPVADLRVMNVLEDCGGRICGTDYMFCHALDAIPADVEPVRALAMMVLADPMVGSAADRASRICRDARACGAEAVVISRVPGASHCALEGPILAEAVRSVLGLPVVELEVPPLADAMMPALKARLLALVETAGARRCG